MALFCHSLVSKNGYRKCPPDLQGGSKEWSHYCGYVHTRTVFNTLSRSFSGVIARLLVFYSQFHEKWLRIQLCRMNISSPGGHLVLRLSVCVCVYILHVVSNWIGEKDVASVSVEAKTETNRREARLRDQRLRPCIKTEVGRLLSSRFSPDHRPRGE